MAITTQTKGKGKGKGKGTTGLYSGKYGAIGAQTNPQPFVNYLATMTGMGPTTGTAYDDWLNTAGYAQIYGGYQNALANDEELMLQNYMRQAGSHLASQLEGMYKSYSANASPQTYFATALDKAGITGSKRAGTAPDTMAFYNGDYYNQMYTDYTRKHLNAPNLGWDEFLSGEYTQTPELAEGGGTYKNPLPYKQGKKDSRGKGKVKGSD